MIYCYGLNNPTLHKAVKISFTLTSYNIEMQLKY